MLDNPPIVSGNAPVILAWPLDRLLDQGKECVGYVMPYVRDKEPLFTVSHPGTRPQWADHPCLLRAAKHVALAVSAFHRHGYVVGDLNEFNILIGPDASVAVVDTDSIQVRTPRELFRCQVGKPEFTPPELIRAGTSFDQVDRYPHHDAFGVAVLVFLLLMDGNHPFAARYVGTAGRQTQTQRIAQGQWPYSARRTSAYRPRRQAPPLESLSPRLQQLVRDCFEAGHANPTCRPSADDWHRRSTMRKSSGTRSVRGSGTATTECSDHGGGHKTSSSSPNACGRRRLACRERCGRRPRVPSSLPPSSSRPSAGPEARNRRGRGTPAVPRVGQLNGK
jgi:DNA-binding helix-hairpin-helix protein with protein kinase domain